MQERDEEFSPDELNQEQKHRLSLLWKDAEIRQQAGEIKSLEYINARQEAQFSEDLKNSTFNPMTNQMEVKSSGLFGGIASGFNASPSGYVTSHGDNLKHDLSIPKAQWKKLTKVRKIIFGRDTFINLDRNARFITEKETVSFYEEAFWLLLMDLNPDLEWDLALADKITMGSANKEEEKLYHKLTVEYKKSERKRKRKLFFEKVIDIITPRLTLFSLPFFAVALFNTMVVEPAFSPLIPFFLGFYANKLLKTIAFCIILYLILLFFYDLIGGRIF